MKTTSISLTIIILLFTLGAMGQNVQFTRSVLGSSGSFSTGNNVTYSSTTGDVMVRTLSAGNTILTQGFQQPSVYALQNLSLQITTYNASCLNSQDGYAVVTVLNGTPPYTYQWTPSGGFSDSTEAILPGEYIVQVTDAFNRTGLDTAIVGSVIDDVCDLYFYSGLTPNGDGDNDTWTIDGINNHPDNSITIFSRWGDEVWEGAGYDNGNVVWDGSNKGGGPLPGGTYFYMCEIPGLDIFTGWVQLMR